MKDFARASALYGFSEQATEYGLDPVTLLTEVGLSTDILTKQEGLVSYRRFLLLLEKSAVLSGDALFGLKLGLRQGIKVFGPILYLLNNASTVGEALAELRQFFHLHMGAAHVELTHVGDCVQLSYHVFDVTQQGLIQGIELAIGVGVQLIKTLMGKNWQPHSVLFAHSASEKLGRYTELLDVKPIFNSENNSIILKQEDLRLPLNQADTLLHTLVREHLETMERLTDFEIADYVERLLKELLPQGRVNVNQIAQCMAISRRTLQRRLCDAGTTFQQVLDKSRQAMAVAYLRDSRLQITQLAELLGYAEIGAFTHAFTRWFGISPSEWRMQQHKK